MWAALGLEFVSRGQAGKRSGRTERRIPAAPLNYLTRRELVQAVTTHFEQMVFAEEHMIKHSYGNARRIYPLVRLFPFVARIYSDFYARVIFLRKPLTEVRQ